MEIRCQHEILQAQSETRVAAIFCGKPRWMRAIALGILCVATIAEINCGIAGKPSGVGPSSVTVTPPSASLLLGATQQFQADVSDGSSTAVTWEVNGVPGGAASSGTISAAGLYTAPAVLPSPPGVTVTAVSQAGGRASGSANVSLSDDIVVMVAPPTVNVPTGGEQVFTAS